MDRIILLIMFTLCWEFWSALSLVVGMAVETVCGYLGGCLKCTANGLKFVILNDNVTSCCTSNVATLGFEYAFVYEKPSECPAELDKMTTGKILLFVFLAVVIFVSALALIICITRKYRRRMYAVPTAVGQREPQMYAAAYHVENPVYDNVDEPHLPPRPASGRANVEITAIVPYDAGAVVTANSSTSATNRQARDNAALEQPGTSSFQAMTVWDPSGQPGVTADELRDFNTLQQWSRIDKKARCKQEWVEMTYFK